MLIFLPAQRGHIHAVLRRTQPHKAANSRLRVCEPQANHAWRFAVAPLWLGSSHSNCSMSDVATFLLNAATIPRLIPIAQTPLCFVAAERPRCTKIIRSGTVAALHQRLLPCYGGRGALNLPPFIKGIDVLTFNHLGQKFNISGHRLTT
jgi:hypothetical protein